MEIFQRCIVQFTRSINSLQKRTLEWGGTVCFLFTIDFHVHRKWRLYTNVVSFLIFFHLLLRGFKSYIDVMYTYKTKVDSFINILYIYLFNLPAHYREITFRHVQCFTGIQVYRWCHINTKCTFQYRLINMLDCI